MQTENMNMQLNAGEQGQTWSAKIRKIHKNREENHPLKKKHVPQKEGWKEKIIENTQKQQKKIK